MKKYYIFHKPTLKGHFFEVYHISPMDAKKNGLQCDSFCKECSRLLLNHIFKRSDGDLGNYEVFEQIL